MITAITGARVFDGEGVDDTDVVVLDGATIAQLGGPIPAAAHRVDARGKTLLPGLIDSHAHAVGDALRLAVVFGVTTEMEMGGFSTRAERDRLSDRDDLADIRSAGAPVTAPNGHPSQMFARRANAHPGEPVAEDFPQTASADQARRLVAELVASGSDYIKFILEDGSVFGTTLPSLDHEAFAAGVSAAHDAGKLAVTHAQTVASASDAVRTGSDGLVHLYIDRTEAAPGLATEIAAAGLFVVPCFVIVSSILGRSAAGFAADPRVANRLPEPWRRSIAGTINSYPAGNIDDAFANVADLIAAGVDLLVGTDATGPSPSVAGLAHGASVHHEMQLLVHAGLTPQQALRAATSLPARRFGLHDRGRIRPGLRADLVLVDGDPTTTIADSLSISDVWRRGVRLAP